MRNFYEKLWETEKSKVNRHIVSTPDFQRYYDIFLQILQESAQDDSNTPFTLMVENRAKSNVYYIREKETFIYAVKLGYRLAMKNLFSPDDDITP